MKYRRISSWESAIPVMTLLLACGLIGPVWAEDSETEIGGTVTAVGGSALPTTITVETADGTVTVNCTVDTEFEVDDDQTTMTDLSLLVGLFAKVEYDPATNTAHGVEVEHEFEVSGEVVKVEGTAFPYTLTLQSFFGPPVALTVTASTELNAEDDGAVTDLPALVGQFVEAEYDSRTGVASEIEVDTDRKFATGRVTSLDPSAGILVVRTRAGEVTFLVNAETDLDLDFQEADFADLVPGTLVVIEFEVDSAGKYVAEEINAVTPRLEATSGTITEVSATGHVVEVRSQGLTSTRPRTAATGPSQPAPTVLKVNAGTLVVLEGRRVSLDAVPLGCRFHAKYVTHEGVTVARKLICKLPPPVPIGGTLKSVTLSATTTAARRAEVIDAPSVGTIEVVLRDGTTVVPVAIYPETRIKLNGKLASPTQLRDLVQAGGQARCEALCIPILAGQNADGTDRFTYHCFRLHAKQVPSSSAGG